MLNAEACSKACIRRMATRRRKKSFIFVYQWRNDKVIDERQIIQALDIYMKIFVCLENHVSRLVGKQSQALSWEQWKENVCLWRLLLLFDGVCWICKGQHQIQLFDTLADACISYHI